MKRIILSLLSVLFAHFLLAQQTGDIYGLNFSSGTLQLASVNPENGMVNIINDVPLSSDQFASGNSDLNHNEGLYHYIRYGQIITADLVTGEVLYEPNLSCASQEINPVVPISNIAYNWMDSTIYGLVHFEDSLWFAKVDPISGVINIVSDGPISSDHYSSGVSDIDPYNGRYFYIRDNRIVTVLISTGEIEQHHSIDNLNDAVAPITNIAYDWLSGQIYGLNYVGSVWDNQGTITAPAELRLATVDPTNGDLTILSVDPLSSDQFSNGVSDIDPLNLSYYYIRANKIYTVNILTGELINSSPLSNPNSAVQPITNIGVYKNQTTLPLADSEFEDMHSDLEVQFKNLSAYSYSAKWNFGDGNESTNRHPLHNYYEPGTYEVTLISHNLLGESDTLSRTITVTGATVGMDEYTDSEQVIRLFPNPAVTVVGLESKENLIGYTLTTYDINGIMVNQIQLSESFTSMDILDFEPGVYFIEIISSDKNKSWVERLIVK